MLTMLKKLRKQNRITQRNLAEALHISQTSVSKYERGESEPDLEMVIKSLTAYAAFLLDVCNSYLA